MNNPEATERLVLWAIEHDELDIRYRPRTTIKAQALADFISEFTTKEDEEVEPTVWIMWTDNSSNQRAGRAGILLRSPEGDTIECVIHLQFSLTNKKVEYTVVLSGLDLAKAVGAASTIIDYNSQVIVGHINGDYEAKGEQMKAYSSMVRSRMSEEFSATFVQVPREESEQADRLAKVASAKHTGVINQNCPLSNIPLPLTE
ncbi:uncharacterized protein LOC142612188 [Castanea sativa]|uniref:uncharacterized protein LOC142612188 n=1 Tax=Castanea sativa TaxID=21020 RepID=UPI003F64FC7A